MKVFSTAFQSYSDPTRLAMYSAVAEDATSANQIGFARLLKEQGNLNWFPVLTLELEVDTTKKDQMIKMAETKNWLLNTIVKNKDRKLFNASKKYLTNQEMQFIKSKIYKIKNI